MCFLNYGFFKGICPLVGFPDDSMVKNSPSNAGDAGSIPKLGTSLGRKWQPTPIFLSGKSHGQRSLVGCSPRGCKRVGHNLVTKKQHVGVAG